MSKINILNFSRFLGTAIIFLSYHTFFCLLFCYTHNELQTTSSAKLNFHYVKHTIFSPKIPVIKQSVYDARNKCSNDGNTAGNTGDKNAKNTTSQEGHR